jgi:hypothetical protein
MKSMFAFAMVLVAACATQPGDDPEATGATKLDPQQKGLSINLPTIYTKDWDDTMKQTEQVDLLWPSGAMNVQLLYRTGPTVYLPTTSGTDEAIPTYLAFHVVDGAVQNVWMIATGTPKGANMKAAALVAINEHTNKPADFDNLGGTSGNGVKGTPPAPTPIIDNYVGFAISGAWQQQAISATAQITTADNTFAAYYENE